jgi:hypothetical protein
LIGITLSCGCYKVIKSCSFPILCETERTFQCFDATWCFHVGAKNWYWPLNFSGFYYNYDPNCLSAAANFCYQLLLLTSASKFYLLLPTSITSFSYYILLNSSTNFCCNDNHTDERVYRSKMPSQALVS